MLHQIQKALGASPTSLMTEHIYSDPNKRILLETLGILFEETQMVEFQYIIPIIVVSQPFLFLFNFLLFSPDSRGIRGVHLYRLDSGHLQLVKKTFID